MAALQTDSDRTSVSPNRGVPFIRTRREAITADLQVWPVVVAHPDVRPWNALVVDFERSAEHKFNTNLIISSPSQISVINANWDAVEYFVFGIETSTSVQGIVQDWRRKSAQGQMDLSKTIETWTIASSFDVEFTQGLSELRSIVSAIQLGLSPQCLPEFEELLGRALAAHGTPTDLDKWARQLAEDVRNLDD